MEVEDESLMNNMPETLSLAVSERSTNTLDTENASTRALANFKVSRSVQCSFLRYEFGSNISAVLIMISDFIQSLVAIISSKRQSPIKLFYLPTILLD